MGQYKSFILITIIGLSVLFSGCTGKQEGLIPTVTPTVTSSPLEKATPFPEATPTGNKTPVKLDARRGFIPIIQTIEPGDEIVWNNIAVDTITLVSDDGLFNNQILSYDKQYRTIFRKIGKYNFHLENDKNLNGTVIVEIPSNIVQTPTSTELKELPSTSIFVETRMLKPVFWNPENYELRSLKIVVTNQINEKLTIKSQILSDNQVLEEKLFILENNGESYHFTNEKKHFINSTNVTLRLLIDGYLPKEYAFKIVGALN
jgi:plastocyanin